MTLRKNFQVGFFEFRSSAISHLMVASYYASGRTTRCAGRLQTPCARSLTIIIWPGFGIDCPKNRQRARCRTCTVVGSQLWQTSQPICAMCLRTHIIYWPLKIAFNWKKILLSIKIYQVFEGFNEHKLFKVTRQPIPILMIVCGMKLTLIAKHVIFEQSSRPSVFKHDAGDNGG